MYTPQKSIEPLKNDFLERYIRYIGKSKKQNSKQYISYKLFCFKKEANTVVITNVIHTFNLDDTLKC